MRFPNKNILGGFKAAFRLPYADVTQLSQGSMFNNSFLSHAFHNSINKGFHARKERQVNFNLAEYQDEKGDLEVKGGREAFKHKYQNFHYSKTIGHIILKSDTENIVGEWNEMYSGTIKRNVFITR